MIANKNTHSIHATTHLVECWNTSNLGYLENAVVCCVQLPQNWDHCSGSEAHKTLDMKTIVGADFQWTRGCN